MKKKIDERQEQEVLRIEHYALWTLFWLLVASIPIQLVLFRNALYVAGECGLSMIVSLYILIACIKKGAWGIYTVPSLTSSILSGLLAAVIGTIVVAVLTWGSMHRWLYIFVSFIALFIIAFLLAWAIGVFVKKRREKLADENDGSD